MLLASNGVRVWRETEASGINIILNHPAVRPWIADLAEGEIDLSMLVADQNNYLLMGEHGAFFLRLIMDGTYEAHAQVLPAGRGRWARNFTAAGLDWMFGRSNAWEIVARVPGGHIASQALVQGMGFRKEFVSPVPCRFRERQVPATSWRISIHEWVSRSADLLEKGKTICGSLNMNAFGLGTGVPFLTKDDYLAQVVATFVDLVKSGLIIKAAYFYNRWALLARHTPISVVSVDPPLFHMEGVGNLVVHGDKMEIVIVFRETFVETSNMGRAVSSV